MAPKRNTQASHMRGWVTESAPARTESLASDEAIFIQAGESKNGRYYSPEVLQVAAPLFVGQLMFADHASESEQYERPERSIKDVVGVITEAHYGTFETPSGTVEGVGGKFQYAPSASWVRENVSAGVLGDLSVTAYLLGDVDESGRFVVESIFQVASVDFVTHGAAGGKASESVREADMSRLVFVSESEGRGLLMRDGELEEVIVESTPPDPGEDDEEEGEEEDGDTNPPAYDESEDDEEVEEIPADSPSGAQGEVFPTTPPADSGTPQNSQLGAEAILTRLAAILPYLETLVSSPLPVATQKEARARRHSSSKEKPATASTEAVITAVRNYIVGQHLPPSMESRVMGLVSAHTFDGLTPEQGVAWAKIKVQFERDYLQELAGPQVEAAGRYTPQAIAADVEGVLAQHGMITPRQPKK